MQLNIILELIPNDSDGNLSEKVAEIPVLIDTAKDILSQVKALNADAKPLDLSRSKKKGIDLHFSAEIKLDSLQ